MKASSPFCALYCFLILFISASCSDKKDEPDQVKLESFASVAGVNYIDNFILPEFNKNGLTTILRDCSIHDDINNRDWSYNVVLPPDYNPDETYPVIYLLHGKTCDSDKWITSLHIDEIFDYYYSQGFPPLIAVMPNADDSYYVDDYLDDIKYESFFTQIFLPEIENKFPVATDKSGRFIGGFSMGGYGAAYYSIKYPDLFSFCYSMSAPLGGRNSVTTPSIPSLLLNLDPSDYPEMIFDIGVDDSFLSINIEAHLSMLLLKFPHEFIIREGGHNVQFWRESLYILLSRLHSFLESTI